MPFVPELARTTLLALGAHQATEWDDFRDAEPGKILHELRHGELAHFGERPHSPYFGSADATPLFLIVLDEYERWTGDVGHGPTAGGPGPGRAGVDGALRRPRRRRLHRVPDPQPRDRPGQPVLEGLLELDRLSRRHDSPRCRGPAARSRGTPTTRGCARPGWPARSGTIRRSPTGWSRTRRALQGQLRPRLLAAGRGFYALALDGDKKPVPTLTSNIGHLLWSGIVRRRAGRVGGRAPDRASAMFSGWGVRTLADGPAGLQPDRVPQRHRVAARHRAGRGRPGPLRPAPGGQPARGRAAGGGRPLRLPAAGGVRRLCPRRARPVPVEYPTRVLAAGLGDRRAAAADAGHARPGADGRTG